MHTIHTHLANWANYPTVDAQVSSARDRTAIREWVIAQPQLTVRGNGKCYGDAALGANVLSTLELNKVLRFDAVNGIIECESGVLLSNLLPILIPAGWFLHVTPGIKAITVGGAVASDVHGKNHPSRGCFSNWLISFELLTGSGEIVTCSRTENSTLFWQTCGGMGWTGVVLSAKFQLRRITSTQMRQTTVQARNLPDLFRIFNAYQQTEYAAAWLDGTAKWPESGRATVFLAEHLEDPAHAETDTPLLFAPKKSRNIPFFAPSWLLNPWSIRAYNELYNLQNPPGEQLLDMDAYFYPLDRLHNWNRLYGRRGFVQYQFCLPETACAAGFAQILETIRRSRETPFLTVMKRHGDRPVEAIHSFPIRGYSLAIDFPRTSTVLHLIAQLDELVWQFGGKIYLAKDAVSQARMGRVDPATFGEAKFGSVQKQRIARP